jgi:hypothetical protein
MHYIAAVTIGSTHTSLATKTSQPLAQTAYYATIFIHNQQIIPHYSYKISILCHIIHNQSLGLSDNAVKELLQDNALFRKQTVPAIAKKKKNIFITGNS